MGWPGVNLQTAIERLAFAQAWGGAFSRDPSKIDLWPPPLLVILRGDRSGFFNFFGD
jgi:hypothetical protein